MSKILFLSANPDRNSPLELIKEFKEIESVIGSAKYGSKIDLAQAHEVSLTELQNRLLKFRPRIVHFSGHGSDGELVFQSTSDEAEMAPIEAIGNLFKIANQHGNICCVVLNACYTKEQAKEISKYVDCVIGTSDAISDAQAIAFDQGFYNGLANSKSIQAAIALGHNQLELQSLPSEVIDQELRRSADPGRIYLIEDVEIFRGAQEYGLVKLQQDFFEDYTERQRDLEDWRKGFPFRLESIKGGLEYRRNKVIDAIEKKLDKQGGILVVGGTGFSKTTIFYEVICDYYDAGYAILLNEGNKIKNGYGLQQYVEGLLKDGNKVLVAVDNSHTPNTAAIFFVMDRILGLNYQLRKNVSLF